MDIFTYLVKSDLTLWLPDGLAHLLLYADDVLYGLVSQAQRFQHHLLRHPSGVSFDRQNGLCRAGQAQIDGAVLHFGGGGVENVLPADVAHPHCAHRSVEGDIGDGQSRRSTDDGQDVQVVLLVGRESGDDDLDFVAPTFGEKGSEGTVREATEENGRFAGTAFAFKETTGDFTRCVEPFFVVHDEGQEINPLPWFLRGCGCGQDHGVTAAHGDSPTSLTGQLARLEANGMFPNSRGECV